MGPRAPHWETKTEERWGTPKTRKNQGSLTRAKKKVIFVGDPAAYAMAIRNDKTLVRQTDLVRKLTHLDQAG